MSDLEAERYEAQASILELLADIQRTSAPIEVSIGWVGERGTVQQGIVIKSAPAMAVQKLVEAGYDLEIMQQGVRVFKIP